MTDRIHALTVILDEPIRDDDIHTVVNAIKMIRGVNGVKTHVVDATAYYAVEKAKGDLRAEMMKMLIPEIS